MLDINILITQLQEQLESSNQELDNIRTEILELGIKRDIRKSHIKEIQNQITQIQADQYEKEAQKRLIRKGYTFIGKTDKMNPQGIYAECDKCHQYLLLFEYGTGIGSTYKGVCPECDIVIDFTDYKSW